MEPKTVYILWHVWSIGEYGIAGLFSSMEGARRRLEELGVKDPEDEGVEFDGTTCWGEMDDYGLMSGYSVEKAVVEP